MIGFLVEQLCLSTISNRGLSVDKKHYKPGQTLVFKDSIPSFEISKNGTTFYVPFAFNFPALDGLILEVNGGDVDMLPIQITVSKHHKNSTIRFLANWRNRKRHFEGTNLCLKFVWITPKRQETQKIEEKKKGS
jgi:hypothetical protein